MANTTSKIVELIRVVRGKPAKKNFTSAVILAAGSSTRMGAGQRKQFLEIDGMPVVARTLVEFEKAVNIHEIIIVAHEDEIDLYESFPEKYNLTKPLRVIAGGETRQESARFGSDCVSDKCKFICIHDAARCLITAELIDRACHGAYLHGNAALAIRATDTVKIVEKNHFVESTPERKYAFLAQTPQVFTMNAYRAAAYIARDEKIEATDDCMLLEHIEIPVKLLEGSRENIKITEPCDILFAEAILKARGESEEK